MRIGPDSTSLILGSLLSLLLGLGEASPTIVWSESEVCPGAEAELELAIASYLRNEASEDVALEAAVRLVDAGPVGMRLELEIATAAGTEQHELAASSCERLLDHAALLIASAIDPFLYAWTGPGQAEAAAERHHRSVAVQRPRASPVVIPPAEQQPRVETNEAPPATAIDPDFGPLALSEPTRARPPITGALSVGATTFVGLFPDPGGGVELEGALERGPLRWHTGVNGWFGGRFRASDAEVGGNLWALGLASALCGVPKSRRVIVPLCASAGVGFISARAVGTTEQRQNIQPWAHAGAEARALLLIREDLAIGLGIGAHAALLRPAWEVHSPGVRFRVPPVMGVLRLTFEARSLGKTRRSAIKPR